MFEILKNIDSKLLLFLNGFHSDFLDTVMFQITKFWFWYPVVALIIFLLIKKFKKKFWIPLILIVCCFALTDIGSNIAKKNFKRYRPTYNLEIKNEVHVVKEYRGGEYGFFSGHAANSFGLAIISLLFIRKRWYSILVLSWAVLVSFSRIYLGVHYPADIFVGAVFGIFISVLIYFSQNKFTSQSKIC